MVSEAASLDEEMTPLSAPMVDQTLLDSVMESDGENDEYDEEDDVTFIKLI